MAEEFTLRRVLTELFFSGWLSKFGCHLWSSFGDYPPGPHSLMHSLQKGGTFIVRTESEGLYSFFRSLVASLVTWQICSASSLLFQLGFPTRFHWPFSRAGRWFRCDSSEAATTSDAPDSHRMDCANIWKHSKFMGSGGSITKSPGRRRMPSGLERAEAGQCSLLLFWDSSKNMRAYVGWINTLFLADKKTNNTWGALLTRGEPRDL